MSTKIYVGAFSEMHGCTARGELEARVSKGFLEFAADGVILFDIDPFHARKLADLLYALSDSVEAANG